MPRRRVMHRVIVVATGCVALTASQGCASAVRTHLRIERAAAAVLSLDPDANWTACVNDLISAGPQSVDWLMRQPCMQRPAPPDDLAVLMHTSLVRLLAPPGAVKLTTTALQVRSGLVYFELRVGVRRVGEALWSGPPPETWPELFAAGFDVDLADASDLEADRRRLRAWWRSVRDTPARLIRRSGYQPKVRGLWRLLAWYAADRWYPHGPAGVLCRADAPERSLTLPVIRSDYNVVRSACIWLGSRRAPEVQRRLIDLVGSEVPVVRHNALFALSFSPRPQIRSLLERYRRRAPVPERAGLWVRVGLGRLPWRESLEAIAPDLGYLPLLERVDGDHRRRCRRVDHAETFQ